MNLTWTPYRPIALALGLATAVVLWSLAAGHVPTASPEADPPAPLILPPVGPAPAGDTGVPDAATALQAVQEAAAEPVPSF